jgi:hypothetical protein
LEWRKSSSGPNWKPDLRSNRRKTQVHSEN